MQKKKTSNPLNQLNAIIWCLKKSKGKYIFLLDGDDYFKKNKIETMIKYFEKYKNINVIQDKPYLVNEKKILKLKEKKFFFSIWPSIYPTSCIAIRKRFFIEFVNFIEKDKFPNLEIDSRLVMYVNLKKKLKILSSSYTFYNSDHSGISSNYTKFSINWWKKRDEAFDYLEILHKKLDIKFSKGPDYFFTKLLNKFI